MMIAPLPLTSLMAQFGASHASGMPVPLSESRDQPVGGQHAWIRTSQIFCAYEDIPQEDRHEAFLHRLRNEGTGRPITVTYSDERPNHYVVQNGTSGAYLALAALQMGMTHLLCEIVPGAVSGVVGLASLSASFPDPSNIFDPSLQRADLKPYRYFGNVHPGQGKIETMMAASRLLLDNRGLQIGESHILAGGKEGSILLPDQGISMATETGFGWTQEDGALAAHYSLPDGTPVRIAAVADGVGGSPLGEMASSVALQVIHAALVESAASGCPIWPHEVFTEIRRVLAFQIDHHQREIGRDIAREKSPNNSRPNTTLALLVTVGQQGFAGIWGDAFLCLGATDKNDRLKFTGHTNVMAQSANVIETSAVSGDPLFYAFNLSPNSLAFLATDGGAGSVIPYYKQRGSCTLRKKYRQPELEQSAFYALCELVARAPRGQEGPHILQTILGAMPRLGLFMPPPEMDNMTIGILRGEEVTDPTHLEVPSLYQPLEPILPPLQRVYRTTPEQVSLTDVDDIIVGNEMTPDQTSRIILPDRNLKKNHVRIFRTDQGDYRIEKIVPDLTQFVVIFTASGKIREILFREGASTQIGPGEEVRLTAATRFKLCP